MSKGPPAAMSRSPRLGESPHAERRSANSSTKNVLLRYESACPHPKHVVPLLRRISSDSTQPRSKTRNHSPTMRSSTGMQRLIDNAVHRLTTAGMSQSTLTDKFQTTIPRDVRKALGLRPRQRLSYAVQKDGSVIVRPEPGLSQLFGSLKLNRPAASTREEKNGAREAMARDAAAEGSP